MNEIEQRLDFETLRGAIAAKRLCIDNGVSRLFPEMYAVALLSGYTNLAATITKLGGNVARFRASCRDAMMERARTFTAASVNYLSIELDESVREMARVTDEFRFKSGHSRVGPIHMLLGVIKTSPKVEAAFLETGIEMDTLIESGFKTAQSDLSSQQRKARAEHLRIEREVKGQRTEQSVMMECCEDLTARAREGKLDPVIGRETELNRVICTLSRKRKNNPVLVGAEGTGKTAVVEALAQRIASGDVPPKLTDKRILSLDISAVVAGTQYRGQFEERMQQIIQVVKHQKNIILFIDEVHTVIGAGSAQGSLDAANILKPFLARGECCCIGATTDSEYKKVFRKDKALARRFQRIPVDEPTPAQTIEMLKGLQDAFETHHDCTITEEAIEAAVELSGRHIRGRFFPDKAIDVLDDMGSRFGGGGASLTREHVARTVAAQAGVPIEAVISNDTQYVARLEKELHCRVAGQERAVGAVLRAVRRAFSPLRDPSRPLASMIFGGPSSVGKSHVAGIIAREICPGAPVIRLNMAEFTEKHDVSRLFGAPPGYVGHGDSNQLTDRVARYPHSVVLFDNLDKAHPDVVRSVMEVLDTGVMTDGEGTEVSFRSCFVIMTTVAGSYEATKSDLGFGGVGKVTAEDTTHKKLMDACTDLFGDEFVNRVDQLVPFLPLGRTELRRVAVIAIDEVAQRLATVGMMLRCDNNVIDRLIAEATNARLVRAAVRNEIEPLIAGASTRAGTKAIRVRLKDCHYMIQ